MSSTGLGAAVLLGCCALAPWGHAVAKCDTPTEVRSYELLELVATDGGSVPETVQARWAEGATVRARIDGVSLTVVAIDEAVIMEREAGQ